MNHVMTGAIKKKTVLLLGINARYTHSNPALYYLREYCRDLDYRFIIHEAGINREPSVLLEEITSLEPDVVGVSVYIWNALRVRGLLKGIRALLPRCIIILGGPEVSYTAEDWLKEFPEINHIITGPGEAGMRGLLENDLSLNEKVITIPNPPLREIPFPYREEDIERLKDRYVYYEASRGCPFRCSYCLSSRRDQALDFRNIEKVKEELGFLSARIPGTIKFVDRTFNADRRFSREIWRYLIENPTATRFHFEIFPTFLEEEDFALLSEVPKGRFQFEIGIQSINPDTLKEIHRPFDWTLARENILRLLEQGTIHVHLDLIAGLPHEGMESFITSFNHVYTLGGHYFQLGFLKILPGTEMEARKSEYGIRHLEGPPYTVQETRWLSRDELVELKRVEYVLNYLYNQGRFKSALALLADRFSSPFEMYRGLAEFLDRKYRKHRSRDWTTGAHALIEMTDRYFPHYRAALMQNLREDWNASMQGRFPPGME